MAARRLSLAAVSRAYSPAVVHWLLWMQSMGSRACGLSSCSSPALKRRLTGCVAQAKLPHTMWNPPGPGPEPMTPALAGGFSTTGPPEKSRTLLLLNKFGYY